MGVPKLPTTVDATRWPRAPKAQFLTESFAWSVLNLLVGTEWFWSWWYQGSIKRQGRNWLSAQKILGIKCLFEKFWCLMLDMGCQVIYRRRWTAEWWCVGQWVSDRWFMGEWIKVWHSFHSGIYCSNYSTLCSIPPCNSYSNLSFNSCQLPKPLKSAERIKHMAQRRYPTCKWSFPYRRTQAPSFLIPRQEKACVWPPLQSQTTQRASHGEKLYFPRAASFWASVKNPRYPESKEMNCVKQQSLPGRHAAPTSNELRHWSIVLCSGSSVRCQSKSWWDGHVLQVSEGESLEKSRPKKRKVSNQGRSGVTEIRGKSENGRKKTFFSTGFGEMGLEFQSWA